MKDKHGKLIWENDIVSIPLDGDLYTLEWNSDNGCWCMNTEDSMYTFDNFWAHEIEVVSNIFVQNYQKQPD